MDLRVSQLAGIKALVVGDIILDRYWSGQTSRISPEAPVPVVRVDSTEDRIGGAGNVAVNVAALGANAVLVGYLGCDDNGERVVTLCEQAGIAAEFIRPEEYPTTVKLRVVSQHQQLVRVDFEGAFDAADGELGSVVEMHIAQCDVLVLSDYAKGALDNPAALIELAVAHGKPVIVDPKGDDFSRYAGATLVTPNLAEFEAVVGACLTTEDIDKKARSLMKQFSIGSLLVTRGEHGMSLVSENHASIHLPAQALDVFDVTGAGDTVCAVAALAFARGERLEDAVVLANKAAGIAVAKFGASAVTPQELSEALEITTSAGHGVIDEHALVLEIGRARARGERVVMTNGCFDLLHRGHVSYLRQAAALGDHLVVAVNTDDSVRRLKGDSRPINSLDDRMAILAALGDVDWVVSFAEDTPQRLIEQLKPDVLVKGGDYAVNEIAGHESVIARGGEVLTLPFVDGVSTTGMIESLQRPGQRRS